MNELADAILSDEHRLLRDETRRFVENEGLPEARERDPEEGRARFKSASSPTTCSRRDASSGIGVLDR